MEERIVINRRSRIEVVLSFYSGAPDKSANWKRMTPRQILEARWELRKQNRNCAIFATYRKNGHLIWFSQDTLEALVYGTIDDIEAEVES